jgi:hypothetical protein
MMYSTQSYWVRLREHRHNLEQDVLQQSKLVQHAYEEGHRVDSHDARILDIEGNSSYRKYKESAIWHAQPIQSPAQFGHFSNLYPLHQ